MNKSFLANAVHPLNSLDPPGLDPDTRASSRVETGMSGNFLSCSKGVKDPLEVPEVRCD